MQTAPITLNSHLIALSADSRGFAAAARLGLDADVPACPDWRVETVVNHLGRVHRWVTAIVRAGATEPPPFPPRPEEISVDWFDEGAQELIDALKEAGPDVGVWTLAGDVRPADFWFRRMAVETAIHRWDVQEAHGQPDPVDITTAVGGMRELDDFYLARAGGFPGSLLLKASEGVEISVGDDEPPATLSGSASDLLLFLWRRVGRDRIEVAGDVGALDRWFELEIP